MLSSPSELSKLLLCTFRSTPDIIILMSVEDGQFFRYIKANPSAISLGAVTSAHFGNRIDEVHSKPYAEKLMSYYQEAVKTQKPVCFREVPDHIAHISKDVVATPIINDGTVTHIVVVARNISEQISAEEKLLVAENRYLSLIEHNPDAMCYCDNRGMILRANPATQTLFGYSPSELVGRDITEFIPKMKRMRLAPEFKMLSNGDSVTFETQATTKTGELADLSCKVVPTQEGGQSGFFVIARDISETKRLQSRLLQSESKYRMITEHLTDLVSVMSTDGVIQYASPSYQRVLGVDPTWYIGQQGRVIVHPDDQENVVRKMVCAVKTQKPQTVEYRKEKMNDGYLFVETTLIPVITEHGNIKHVLALSHDITKRVEEEHKLEELASKDPLTGLLNRRAFMQQLDTTLIEGSSTDSHVLLFLDCDHFKSINDTYGHQAGDEFLIEIARRLEQSVREGDVVSRFAGDEFYVLLKNATREDGEQIVERMKGILHTPIEIEGRMVQVTTSIGMACYPNESIDPDELIQMADDAMYGQKLDRRR